MRRAELADIPAVAELLNDPEIRPTVGGEGYLDPTALIADPRNVCLFDERGGAMFAWRGPGIYEGHSFFRVRGRQAIHFGKFVMAAMLELVGARMIWGLTPVRFKHVRWFNRKVGFESRGVMSTPEGDQELFVMENV